MKRNVRPQEVFHQDAIAFHGLRYLGMVNEKVAGSFVAEDNLFQRGMQECTGVRSPPPRHSQGRATGNHADRDPPPARAPARQLVSSYRMAQIDADNGHREMIPAPSSGVHQTEATYLTTLVKKGW